MKTVHILNGDSIKDIFAEQGIAGDLIIWREALSEGPTTTDVGSERFFQARSQFFASQYQIPEAEFIQKAKAEFRKLDSLSQYEEVVLWFEYDLFCQINMLAACSYLYQQLPQLAHISLVCLGEHPSSEGLIALGEIDPSYYPELFTHRVALTQEDLRYAHAIWEAYNAASHLELAQLVQDPPSVFPYLKEAIHAHFKRFPHANSGLNEIETDILSLAEEGVANTRKLVGSMLKKDRLYGAGDMSYFAYLSRLQDFIASEQPTSITEGAQAILQGTEKGTLHQHFPLTFGGSRTDEYVWSAEKDRLLRRTA